MHTEVTINKILSSLHHATQYDDTWYKAWHTWALMNFEAVAHYEKSRETSRIEQIEVCSDCYRDINHSRAGVK